MRQTVRYAKARALTVPDAPGTYYGNNFPGSFRLNNERWARTAFAFRNTRGVTTRKGN